MTRRHLPLVLFLIGSTPVQVEAQVPPLAAAAAARAGRPGLGRVLGKYWSHPDAILVADTLVRRKTTSFLKKPFRLSASASQVGDDLLIHVNTLASGRFVHGFGPFSITLLNRKPPPGDTTMVKAMAGLLRSASTWREHYPGVKRVTFYAPTLVNPQLANQLRSLGFTEVKPPSGQHSQLVIGKRQSLGLTLDLGPTAP